MEKNIFNHLEITWFLHAVDNSSQSRDAYINGLPSNL